MRPGRSGVFLKILASIDLLCMQITLSPFYWVGFVFWALWWKFHDEARTRLAIATSVASVLMKTTYVYSAVAFTYIPAVLSGLVLVHISATS